MEYRKFGSDYLLRIDKGEEILQVISELCAKEGITLGTVSGLGAVGEVTLGVFDRQAFQYVSRTYTGDLEIASCNGNISTMDGNTYLHIHMVAGNPKENICCGGHLNRGVISLTGEFWIHAVNGGVDRKYSPEIGLNLIQLTD